jgi:hypothetical protein
MCGVWTAGFAVGSIQLEKFGIRFGLFSDWIWSIAAVENAG